MNIVRTILRIKPKESKKNRSTNSFNNEFYIASNEFSKQKLISYYGIEDCAITAGHGSCVKLESIFGASTISRGSSGTLTNSNITLNNSRGNSAIDIKYHNFKSSKISKEINEEEKEEIKGKKEKKREKREKVKQKR